MSEEKDTKQADPKSEETPQVPPVETQHELNINGEALKYTATTGMMPLKNQESGETEGQVFFVAYTLSDVNDISKRPLVFAFNGGPGAASVWLHLGALGPKRVKMQSEGFMPAPPYELVANDHTWLEVADLVFIDPIGTGYSRATKSDYNKKFWNMEGDLQAISDVIRLYLTRYERWRSPLFLAGESYGAFRAAGLSNHLVSRGIGLNGIMLISTILNYQGVHFTAGNDLPYILHLPTYASTAWYHGKLEDDLQARPLRELLNEVETWAETDYNNALTAGDNLSHDKRQEVIEKLARYTGLSETYVDNANLRINIMRFCNELLRDDKRTIGRLDSRFKARERLATAEYPEFDPSLTAITPPYTAMMNAYAREELGYETDTEYETLSFAVNQAWEFPRGQFPDTSDALRLAFAKNPYMKLFVGQGYYDLATVHLAVEYTLSHMNLDPDLRENVQLHYYEAGHMFYLDVVSLAKLKDDVRQFIVGAIMK